MLRAISGTLKCEVQFQLSVHYSLRAVAFSTTEEHFCTAQARHAAPGVLPGPASCHARRQAQALPSHPPRGRIPLPGSQMHAPVLMWALRGAPGKSTPRWACLRGFIGELFAGCIVQLNVCSPSGFLVQVMTCILLS